MSIISSIRTLLAFVFRRPHIEREMEEELRSHLRSRADDLERSGLSRAEAERQARMEFGGYQRYKEECREALGVRLFSELIADIRYGLRQLRRNPGFTAVAVITLALGIGANTAIFSVVDEVLLRPLPFKNAARLLDITEHSPGKVDSTGVPYPDYLVWRQQNTVFGETAAYFLISASNDIVLGGPFSTERQRYSIVTNSFFTILGIRPALGHAFSAADQTPGGAKVFLASDTLWHGVFGGDPHAIGKTYLLDGENYVLVGVLPPGFDFPKGCSVWVPTGTLANWGLHDRVSHPFHVLGRLRKGVNLTQAEAQIESIQKHLGEIYPNTDAGWHVRAQPLLDEIVGNVRTSLFVLLGAVGFILLIACTNVVNLMLARAAAREREFAIRIALGAGRVRLLRQNLTEGFIIVSLNAILGVALAKWGLALTVLLTSIHLPRMESFHLSVPVLGFMSAVATFATILVGLTPALEASRRDQQGALQEGQHSGGIGQRGRRLRSGLVVSEVALALVLLCGAGLLLRSFVQLIRVNPGFQPEHLLTMKIALPGGAYPKAEQTKVFVNRLLERLQSLPGVQDAAATTMLPLSGQWDWGTFNIVGRAVDWAHAPKTEGGGGVSISYFQTLGIPLLRGREFTPEDALTHNTVIINEAMAKRFWPGTDPIGQRVISIDERSNPREIVGVVADVKSFGLDTPSRPEMYTPYGGAWYTNFVVRTGLNPATLVSAVREQVAALDKGVPVYQVATMDQLLSRSVAPHRFDVFLLVVFAGLAVSLGAVGIYGVLSFGVSQRTHEIGVRVALGAQKRDVLRLVIGEGMILASVGVGIGLIGALGLTRFLSSLLYEVKPTDPLTFAAVSFILMGVALLACYIPARRATKVDPMVALRYE